MTTWEVLVIYDQDDTHHTDVDAETIEDAAHVIWDEWHPTGWREATVTGPGPDDWGWINLDADDFNFSRNPT